MSATWLLLLLVHQFSAACGLEDHQKRPIWNIAHMVNAISQVDSYLDDGANSLEFDITFDSNGRSIKTYHGIPCDCFRDCLFSERVDNYLEYMSQITTPGHPKYRKNYILLFLDLKLGSLSDQARSNAGEDIATKLLDIYWKRGKVNTTAYVLLSLPSVSHVNFIESFKRTLKNEGFAHYEPKIGYDFSNNENMDSIGSTYKRLGIEKNVWQGDGITNCLPRGTSRLREACSRRDSANGSYMDKVYYWTVDKESTIQRTLSIGVDGMITNYPARVVNVLKQKNYHEYMRMATINDNPWESHKGARSTTWDYSPLEDLFYGDREEILSNC